MCALNIISIKPLHYHHSRTLLLCGMSLIISKTLLVCHQIHIYCSIIVYTKT